MIKSILSALLCFCFLATAYPAGADDTGDNIKPIAKQQDRHTERPESGEKMTLDDLKAAQMAEMLDMMKMLQQLDLMEDYEIVGENGNEKSG